jgi:hypothetical protein
MSNVVNVPVRYVATDLDPIMQPDPIGAWVHMEDYKAQAERIEELEAELEYWREESDLGWDKAEERRAELAKAVGFIKNFALRAMIEEHDEDERDMIDFDSLRFERDCDIVQARSILAVLKGETDAE